MIEIKGRITHIGQTELKGEKQFATRVFVVETGVEYIETFAINALGEDKSQVLDKFQVGDEVKVRAGGEAKEWQGKWYMSLRLISCYLIEGEARATPAPAPAPVQQAQKPSEDPDLIGDVDDNLPF